MSQLPQPAFAGFKNNASKVYEYDFFVSYTRDDLAKAASLANALAARGYFVFFAPESLIWQNSGDNPDDNFWTSTLQIALLRSCHFIGLCSEIYLRRDWAGGLELSAFRNIREANPNRKLALMDLDASVQLEEALKSYRYGPEEVLGWAQSTSAAQAIRLGQSFSPDLCLPPLPLKEISTYPWAEPEDGRHAPFPPYDAYEGCVREMIMILRLGATEQAILDRYSTRMKWKRWDFENALRDARVLVDRGVHAFA